MVNAPTGGSGALSVIQAHQQIASKIFKGPGYLQQVPLLPLCLLSVLGNHQKIHGCSP
jgi:hypothetical protein